MLLEAEDLLDVAHVALRAVADEDFIVAEFDPPAIVIVLDHFPNQEIVSRSGP